MSNKNIIIKEHTTPIGVLILGVFDDKLCLCDWKYRAKRDEIDKRIVRGLKADLQEGDHALFKKVEKQLNDYFIGSRSSFDIPLLFVGSDFQKSVWNALLKIPFGKKETYLGLSHKLGNTKAIRAVAATNGANAISIIVPCHRIVGANGELVGYAGGLNAKKKLLELEGSVNQLSIF